MTLMSTPDRDLDDITGHKDSDRGRNVRISGRAWEIIRWTKYELRTTSYSETIQRLYTNIAKDRKSRLIESMKKFDGTLHQIKVKNPGKEVSSTSRPKTILLDEEAHRTLELIKIESNDSKFTYSDAIEFLAKENGLLPDHLRRD